jgi:hypothetical protein
MMHNFAQPDWTTDTCKTRGELLKWLWHGASGVPPMVKSVMGSQHEGLNREKLGYERCTLPLEKMGYFYLRLPYAFFSICVSGPLCRLGHYLLGARPIFIHVKPNHLCVCVFFCFILFLFFFFFSTSKSFFCIEKLSLLCGLLHIYFGTGIVYSSFSNFFFEFRP